MLKDIGLNVLFLEDFLFSEIKKVYYRLDLI